MLRLVRLHTANCGAGSCSKLTLEAFAGNAGASAFHRPAHIEVATASYPTQDTSRTVGAGNNTFSELQAAWSPSSAARLTRR